MSNEFTVGDELLSLEHKCCICGKKNDLEPHHILHTNKYDELYNSIENLVVMCNSCHHKYHQKYHYNISFKTLLEFKGDYWREYCPKLKKENNILRRNIKKLESLWDE